ncbi:MAG: PaaI family thioesterase [Betaproteobacteria bacterium]
MSLAPRVPEGFRAADIHGDFIIFNGPLFGRLADDQLQLGFRVEQRHGNPLGICHGGMLATFVDMLVPCTAMYMAGRERRFLPTISLQIDYLGSARLGAWVQGEAQILRTTRNLVFGQGLVSADGEPCLRFSGIFKLGQGYGDPANLDPLGLQRPS